MELTTVGGVAMKDPIVIFLKVEVLLKIKKKKKKKNKTNGLFGLY